MSIIVFIQSDRKFGYTSSDEKEKYSISSDGTGYYSYLPQYIVYSDSTNFSFHQSIIEKYPKGDFFSMLYLDKSTKTLYNKFYIGTALVQAPFYLLAHAYQLIVNGEGDGYSLGYRFSIQLAALFYWLLGVSALFSLFQRLNYSRSTILAGIICITFGTNLNYYLAYDTAYSHIYSFSFIALFLNFTHLWVKSKQFKHLLYLTICIGIIAIIRPVNVIVILIIPFFFNNWKDFTLEVKNLFRNHLSRVIICFLIGLLLLFIQLLVHFDQTQQWSLYSYQSEGFSNIFHPQIWNMLFSYTKGYFIYSPIMLLLIPGIYFFKKTSSNYFFWGWTIVVVFSFYIIASWWDWTYGGGLGTRPLIEYLPLYLFAILPLFKSSKKLLKLVLITFAFGTIYLYQVFQIQFNQNIILYSGMNKTTFWKVFLKTDARYSWMLTYNYEQLPKSKLKEIKNLEYINGEWHITDKDKPKFEISIRQDAFVLINNGNGLPKYAQLNGEVKLYDPANNPTMEVKYYSAGVEVHKSEQPFGNKIDAINEFEKIHLEFNPQLTSQIDSIQYTLYHYGKRNDYKDFRLKILD